MDGVGDKKEFSDLGLHLWRIKDEQNEEWREEIYLMGSDDVLQTLIESWQGLLGSYQAYGKGTRRYKCNRCPKPRHSWTSRSWTDVRFLLHRGLLCKSQRICESLTSSPRAFNVPGQLTVTVESSLDLILVLD